MLFICFLDSTLIPNCNAKYGAIEALQTDLQAYANAHIESSFEFLLMSTHFANYEVNREGFQALYRKLSDKLWEDSIDLIKYIAQRGGKMNFNQLPRFKKSVSIIYFFIFMEHLVLFNYNITFVHRSKIVEYWKSMN